MVVLDNSWKVKLAVYDQETKILVKLQLTPLYARYLCLRAHSAKRARDDRVSCIQLTPIKDKIVIVIREESPTNACI